MSCHCFLCNTTMTSHNVVIMCPSCRDSFPRHYENVVLKLEGLTSTLTGALNSLSMLADVACEKLDPVKHLDLIREIKAQIEWGRKAGLEPPTVKEALELLNETGIASPEWGVIHDQFTPEGRLTREKQIEAENKRRTLHVTMQREIDQLKLKVMRLEADVERERKLAAELGRDNMEADDAPGATPVDPDQMELPMGDAAPVGDAPEKGDSDA